jgi:hypothetical protein
MAPVQDEACGSSRGSLPRRLPGAMMWDGREGLHEDPETFNRATLDFLLRQHA